MNKQKKNIEIAEIFKSLQGESRFAGLPCIFIRFSGCNLKCTYCDTLYAKKKGESYSIERIITIVDKLKCKLVEITGGEPLLQNEVYPLIKELFKKKNIVLLETNGSILLKHVPKKVIKIVDFKCPDSGMTEKMILDNIKYMSKNDEAKFVISSRKDYLWAKKIIKKYKMEENTNVLISPVFEQIEPGKISGWILDDNLDVRFQVQLHKIINIK